MRSSGLEFRPAKDQTKARAEAVEAARRYMRTDARINVRLSSADLEMVFRKRIPPFLRTGTM